MPNSLQSSAIASPASRRATNCSLSSITEHSFQGIIPSPLRGESVTYVSGTMCYLCLRPLKTLSLAKTLGVLGFTPLTMLQACAQAVDFKVGHHFGEGHRDSSTKTIISERGICG